MDWRDKSAGMDRDFGDANWLQKMNNAIGYIEDHLATEIDFDTAARLAYCSAHHFQRMFAFIAEVSISAYIRQRRLTLAAFELQSTDAKVIDIALKYGYESPEAFARAFRHMHGVVPSSVRNGDAQLTAYPRITFHISIKGAIAMAYRIEQWEAIAVFGVAQMISTVDHQDLYEVPRFWQQCRENGAIARIQAAAGVSAGTPVHAAIYNCTDTQYGYLLCYLSPKANDVSDFVKLTVPAGTWAVFPTEILSREAVAQQAAHMWKRIFTEWFATSGYELANAPEMEMHFRHGDGKYLTEIWIPITAKTNPNH